LGFSSLQDFKYGKQGKLHMGKHMSKIVKRVEFVLLKQHFHRLKQSYRGKFQKLRF